VSCGSTGPSHVFWMVRDAIAELHTHHSEMEWQEKRNESSILGGGGGGEKGDM